MRKLLVSFLGISLVFFFLVGCSSERGKPTKVTKDYYRYLLDKRYEKAYELILPQNPPAITKENYIKELNNLAKSFQLQKVKVVQEKLKGEEAEVTVEVTELDKERGMIVTSQAKLLLKRQKGKWYISWPKKSSK